MHALLSFLLALSQSVPAAASDPGTRSAPQPEGLRIFISVDLEGVAGAVTPEQLGPGGFEYQRFREFMTDEVLAAMEGAREAGATRFVVADAHGNGQNLLIERFPEDVEIVEVRLTWAPPRYLAFRVAS
jgi:D-amino peptidase